MEGTDGLGANSCFEYIQLELPGPVCEACWGCTYGANMVAATRSFDNAAAVVGGT